DSQVVSCGGEFATVAPRNVRQRPRLSARSAASRTPEKIRICTSQLMETRPSRAICSANASTRATPKCLETTAPQLTKNIDPGHSVLGRCHNGSGSVLALTGDPQ